MYENIIILYSALADCNLEGTFPKVSGFPNLRLLNLSRNNIYGSFPSAEYFNAAKDLLVIDLSLNNLYGTVPNLDPPLNLTILNLQNNSISDIEFKMLAAGINEETKVLLAGNDICSVKELGDVKQVCLSTSDTEWKPGELDGCSEQVCDQGFQVNPYHYLQDRKCTCSSPLNVTLLLRHFSLGAFNSIDAKNVEEEIYKQMSQDMQLNTKVSITSFFCPSDECTMIVQFYPKDGSLNSKTVNNIKYQFSIHNISLGPEVGPYIVISYADPLPKKNKRNRTNEILLSVLIPASVSLILIFALVAFLERRKAIREKEIRKERQRLNIEGLKKFSLKQIKNLTRNFDSQFQLGTGGYGDVYKMQMTSKDGKVELAVKRGKNMRFNVENSMESPAAFLQELQLLSRIHHKNLIDLIGYCTDNKEEILVYPFLSYGNLEQHLRGRFLPYLGWNERLKICLGSARGLAYLHDNADPPIIHRDIKSSNILLDETLEPKVADFGISFANTVKMKEECVKGSLGYLDPEYLETGDVTFKSDVYSFGVLILEIVTAVRPFGYYLEEDADKLSYPDTIKLGIEQDSLAAIVDENMGEYPEEGMAKLVNLAFQCVSEYGSHRPSMQQVVHEIESICRDFGDVEFGDVEFGNVIYVKIPQIVKTNDTDTLFLTGNRKSNYSGLVRTLSGR